MNWLNTLSWQESQQWNVYTTFSKSNLKLCYRTKLRRLAAIRKHRGTFWRVGVGAAEIVLGLNNWARREAYGKRHFFYLSWLQYFSCESSCKGERRKDASLFSFFFAKRQNVSKWLNSCVSSITYFSFQWTLT